MKLSRLLPAALCVAFIAEAMIASAQAGVFIGVGIGRSRPYYAYNHWHGFGPSMPYGVPVVPAPNYGGYYGYPGPYSSYYAPAGYGYAIPAATYAPLPYAAYAYPVPAYAAPVEAYYGGPYRKMEVEYDRGGYEVELKR